jgi:hypothetical protein
MSCPTIPVSLGWPKQRKRYDMRKTIAKSKAQPDVGCTELLTIEADPF